MNSEQATPDTKGQVPGLDLVYLRQLAEATTKGPWLMQGYANAVVLSLLDRIDELENQWTNRYRCKCADCYLSGETDR